MTKIILIGVILLLVWIRIMLPFIRDRLLDRKELELCPIQVKFAYMVVELDWLVYNGLGTLTVYDEQPEYMYMNCIAYAEVSYCFMYTTGNLTVQIILNTDGENRMVEKHYNQLRTIDKYVQQRLAKKIVEDTRMSLKQSY